MNITNPVLSGFYPDPSICRVGRDFYLVNSTFAYFPGIPVHHSRDLVHWTQIGNVIDRLDQLSFEGAGISRGLFAPSIRHHNGTFYVLCTNIDNGGNFIVTAKDPAGPWSDPVWFKDAQGIDPSIFFDDDGSAWYVGTRPAPEGVKYNGNWEVWTQQIDLKTLSLVGPTHGLWRGALRECIWPEGPHLYKINGYYYLMIAEGDTGMDHAISIARSKTLTGPWVGKASNPILTHRHLGRNAELINVGHGDLFDDGEGNWWMVLLASRPYGGTCNLGRETYMVPVRWEDDWPLASADTGLVEKTYVLPAAFEAFAKAEAAKTVTVPRPACEHFDSKTLPQDWLILRTPPVPVFDLEKRPGWLGLPLLAGTVRGTEPVAFAALRQRHMSWSLSALFDFTPTAENECAGLALLQNERFNYRLEIGQTGGKDVIRLVRSCGDTDEVLASVPRPQGKVTVLTAWAEGQNLSFGFAASGEKPAILATGVDGTILSTEKAGGFVGTVLGVFASGNGKASANRAEVDWVEYRAL